MDARSRRAGGRSGGSSSRARRFAIAALVAAAALAMGQPAAGHRAAWLGRLGAARAPQEPRAYRQLLQQQASPPPASPPPAAPASPLPASGSGSGGNGTSGGASSASGGGGGGSASGGGGGGSAIDVCPAWAPAAAAVSGVLRPPSGRPGVSYAADLNDAPGSGLTASGREEGVDAAATAALNASGVERLRRRQRVSVAYDTGVFAPLSSEESLAVYAFLFRQADLNLTPIERANYSDSYVGWLEAAPPAKQDALAFLDQGAPRPERAALALLIEGARKPPRVTQVRVGPLPRPTRWEFVPLGPNGQIEAGWLQRPYSGPEAARAGRLVQESLAPLEPVMRGAFGGFWFDTTGLQRCNTTCLTYSLGAPFGAGPAQPSGTRVDPDAGAANSNSSTGGARVGQRYLWAYFYRNLEGHHLHTVGLEVQFDVSAYDASKWRAGSVWFADRLWPSIPQLVAAWDASQRNDSRAGVAPELLAQLRSFRSINPSAADARYSTFIPRTPEAAAASGPLRSQQPPGPPLLYEPGGRRFRLTPGGNGLDEWMGWSLAIGHRPSTGVSFWDVRFRGERIIYELALQEAYAGYGGPSPMQAHVQYLDSHWGFGTAYKELVAGADCPTNAAFLDLTQTFMTGPIRMRNALCVFEQPLGMPLLRHWADAGGGAAYYGAVPATSLVIRGISAVYNYDYIQDLRLHLDGSIEVAVHTTGYPQPARFNAGRDANKYGYPLWWDVAGTIHDHLLHFKVDLDIGGTSNSVRLDTVVLEERKQDEGFPGAGAPWFSKRVEQVWPEREAQAALYWNGSSRAAPSEAAPPQLIYVVNEDATNRWGSARGYRVQHSLATPQVLPPASVFGNAKGIAWSKYQVAVTARREWEPVSSSPLNQPLPFAPLVDFDDLLGPASDTPPAPTSGSAPVRGGAGSGGGGGAPPAGDAIRRQDLVLWVSTGLQHLPGAEDAPVTPSSGPPLGFWLRPFNYFSESAAVAQPSSTVYIPAVSVQAAYAAVDAVAAGNELFSLAGRGGEARGNTSAGGAGAAGPSGAGQRPLGRDDVTVPIILDGPVLIAARRGIQPYVGVPLLQTCLPSWASVPAFNGSFSPQPSAPLPAAPGNATRGGGGGAAGPSGGGGGGGPTGRSGSRQA